MNILNEPIPGHWPAEAKTLVNDLRRAYRVLESEIDDYEPRAEKADAEVGDEIARECDRMKLTRSEAVIWRKYRQSHGKYIATSQVMDTLYIHDKDKGDDKIVDVLVCKIRKKLVSCGLQYEIETKHGVGKRAILLSEKIQALQGAADRRHPLLDVKIGSFVAQDDIRKLCWAAGVKYAELSKALGLRKGTVGVWVGGHVVMPVKHGAKLANFFKAKQAAMLRATGSKPKLAA